MAIEQVQADIRDLLYEQGQSLDALQLGVWAMLEAVNRIQLSPVINVEPPLISLPDGPQTASPEQGAAAVALAIRASLEPALAALGGLLENLQRSTVTLAEKVATPPPTMMRGGSLSRVSLTDETGTQTVPINTDGGLQVHLTGQTVTPTNGLVDANNSFDTTLLAYQGVPYVPNVGGAPGAIPRDAVAGNWTEITGYAGFSISPLATRLGQGFAEWSNDGGATVHHYETTAFAGSGAFTDPATGSTHYRIVFQNRDPSGTSRFIAKTILRPQSVAPFIFPVAAPIDPSFPAALGRAVITGQQPDGDYENQRVSGSIPGDTTTALLRAGATFTGEVFDATGFVSILVVVIASHPSATDGVRVEFSNDGFVTVNKSHVFTYTAADAGAGRSYSVPANQGEQFRVRYTNGATNQTAFDLRTELSVTIIQPMTDNIGKGTLMVSPGLRLSQVFKRTPFHYALESLTADRLLHTTSAGRIAYVTDMVLTLTNTNLVVGASAVFRDGTGVLGTPKIPLITEPATNQGNARADHEIALADPIAMTRGIFLDFTGGTPALAGFIHGYEEDA